MFDANPALDAGRHAPVRSKRARPAEYRVYFAIVFAVALPIALAGRLFPRALEADGGRAERLSVIGDARRLTNSVIPYLFMG